MLEKMHHQTMMLAGLNTFVSICTMMLVAIFVVAYLRNNWPA